MIYLVAVLVAAVDQAIKWLVATHLLLNQAIPLWPGVVEILYVQNEGAAFSILLNQRAFLLAVTAVVISAVIYVDTRYAKGKRSFKLALGFLLGGAVGNFIDRLRTGNVVDYIYLQFIHFPVFNLADSAIVLSVIYLVLRAWRQRGDEPSGADSNRVDSSRADSSERTDLHDAK